MAGKNNNPKSRETELVVQELKDEVLLYDLKINKAYCLNSTSAIIWNLCDGNNSVSDITKQAGKKLKQTVTANLIYLALDQFKTDDLLADSKEIEIKFDGLSRREVIRKVGFASLVALPVIASLVAPTAAMAQSAGGVAPLGNRGSFCTIGKECISGTCQGVCSTGDVVTSCTDLGTACTGTGTCFGAGTCLPDGGPGGGVCFEDGAPCGLLGICHYFGNCSADRGSSCKTEGAPCSGPGVCIGTACA